MGRRRSVSHLYRRPDSDAWWCWYYDAAGQLRRESTRCSTRAGAEAALADLERRARDPSYAASHETTVERALEHLIAERRDVRGRATGTIHMYKVKSGHLVRVLGASTPLGRVTAALVDGYVTTRLAEGAARTTVGKELTTLRGALRLAKRRGEFHRDLDEVMPEFSAEYEPRRRWLTPRELERLLAELEADRAARVAFIVATGARWGETERAQRVDVHREEVRLRGTKTALSARTVPMLPDDLVPMRRLLDHALEHAEGKGAMFRRWGNAVRDLAAACERAKIERCSPNDLRRTVATWLRARGVAPSLIAPFLGHVDGRMVERVYGRLDVDELRAAIVGQAGREAGVRKRPRSAAKMGKMGTGSGGKSRGRPVPRDGIEPPTRGFSIPAPRGRSDGKDRRSRSAA